jgi:hypothetical protein
MYNQYIKNKRLLYIKEVNKMNKLSEIKELLNDFHEVMDYSECQSIAVRIVHKLPELLDRMEKLEAVREATILSREFVGYEEDLDQALAELGGKT